MIPEQLLIDRMKDNLLILGQKRTLEITRGIYPLAFRQKLKELLFKAIHQMEGIEI